MTVIDCVKSPPADAMHAGGVTGLCRYLSWADQRDTLGKVIHQAEYDALVGAGFTVLLNWEYDAQDYLGGAMRGATHAQEAIRQARALGYPDGCAIVGSADHDVTRADWLGTGRPYYMAFSSGLRVAGYRAGIYGPWDVLGWARDDDVADVFWQAGMSTAWSGGRNAQLWPGAHLRQRRKTFIGGFECDINDVLQADYGQAGGDMDFGSGDVNAWHQATRIDALRKGDDTSGLGEDMTGFYKRVAKEVVATLPAAAAVALSDADRQDIADKVAAQLGGKLDQVLARLAAAGDALDG